MWMFYLNIHFADKIKYLSFSFAQFYNFLSFSSQLHVDSHYCVDILELLNFSDCKDTWLQQLQDHSIYNKSCCLHGDAPIHGSSGFIMNPRWTHLHAKSYIRHTCVFRAALPRAKPILLLYRLSLYRFRIANAPQQRLWWSGCVRLTNKFKFWSSNPTSSKKTKRLFVDPWSGTLLFDGFWLTEWNRKINSFCLCLQLSSTKWPKVYRVYRVYRDVSGLRFKVDSVM